MLPNEVVKECSDFCAKCGKTPELVRVNPAVISCATLGCDNQVTRKGVESALLAWESKQILYSAILVMERIKNPQTDTEEARRIASAFIERHRSLMGRYECLCCHCGVYFRDDDKRAVSCPTCAAGRLPKGITKVQWKAAIAQAVKSGIIPEKASLNDASALALKILDILVVANEAKGSEDGDEQ